MDALPPPPQGAALSKSAVLVVSECEHLIRRMLVLEPRKRHTISQVKHHKWMVSGAGQPKQSPPSPVLGHDPQAGDYNEQILRLMHSLGIDQQKTLQVCFLLFVRD